MSAGKSIAIAVALSIATAAPLLAQTGAQGARFLSLSIVRCDCDTPAKQARMRHRIERAGGKIVYAYRAMGGFAVSASRPGGGVVLERKLKRIRGIAAVQADSAVSPTPDGLP